MVQNDVEFLGVEDLVDRDAYHDLLHDKARSAHFVDELRPCKRMLEEDDKADKDYKGYLLSVLTEDEVEMSEPHKKLRKRDDVSENENDPQCELFLKSLKAYGKSYVLEKYDESGVIRVIEYEREASSDEKCDSDSHPRRILRSAMKQKDRVANVKENKKTENMNQMELRNKAKNGKVENEKHSTNNKISNDREKKKTENVARMEPRNKTNDRVSDPDCLFLYQNSKIIDGHFVYTYGGHTVVYHKSDEENSRDKEDDDDNDSFSDVEILGTCEESKTDPFVMKERYVNLEGYTTELDFRQKVIGVLRKPYDKEEHNKLISDFELRTPGWQHKELRNNRDRSCPSYRDGKSYLDHYPDLGRKLRLCEDDKPKCLNLLRGLFFWLQNSVHNESFQPWQDEECLAIKPESC